MNDSGRRDQTAKRFSGQYVQFAVNVINVTI